LSEIRFFDQTGTGDVNWTELLCNGALQIAVVTIKPAPAGGARL
jgi:hypothetical protein